MLTLLSHQPSHRLKIWDYRLFACTNAADLVDLVGCVPLSNSSPQTTSFDENAPSQPQWSDRAGRFCLADTMQSVGGLMEGVIGLGAIGVEEPMGRSGVFLGEGAIAIEKGDRFLRFWKECDRGWNGKGRSRYDC